MPAADLFTIVPRAESKESDAERVFPRESETADADMREGGSGSGSAVVMMMVARRRRVVVMGILSFMVVFLEFVLLASLL